MREEEHVGYKAIEARWLRDSDATLLAAVDVAIRALAARGGRDTEIEHKYLLNAEPTIPDGEVRDIIEQLGGATELAAS